MAVYLAMYKAKGNWQDKIIRFFTKGDYSHCEIAVEKRVNFTDRYNAETVFDCYTSSPRDNGVRCKQIDVANNEKWDLIPLENITEQQIKDYFHRTSGAKYDWWGVLGIVLGIKQKRSKFFCSEWCFNAITGSEEGWRFSPNQLAVMFTPKEN